MGDWTFFSNYGHVLVCLARNNEARLRDVAVDVGITERAVQKIVRDLQDEAYLVVTKKGRRNHYQINRRKALRHSLQSQVKLGKLLTLLVRPATEQESPEVATAKSPRQAPEADATRPKQAPVASSSPSEKPSPSPAKPVDEGASTAAKEPAKKKDKDKPDTRQQGSLF